MAGEVGRNHTAAGQGQQTEALHSCTWCGHVHDPEDGRCDAHAHVGIGRCRCPGDLQTLKYDRERVRRRIAAAMSGRGYSVMEMAADVERYATHPVWEQAERLDDETERLRTTLLSIAAFTKHPHPAPCGQDACLYCLIESAAAEALGG